MLQKKHRLDVNMIISLSLGYIISDQTGKPSVKQKIAYII